MGKFFGPDRNDQQQASDVRSGKQAGTCPSPRCAGARAKLQYSVGMVGYKSNPRSWEAAGVSGFSRIASVGRAMPAFSAERAVIPPKKGGHGPPYARSRGACLRARCAVAVSQPWYGSAPREQEGDYDCDQGFGRSPVTQLDVR